MGWRERKAGKLFKREENARENVEQQDLEAVDVDVVCRMQMSMSYNRCRIVVSTWGTAPERIRRQDKNVGWGRRR